MKGYLMGVICAAFLCAIVNAVGGEGRGTRRMICGVFLALALLHPLGSLELPELHLDTLWEEAEAAISSGASLARDVKNEIITDSLEAYILTKANELELAVEAEVTVDADGLPVSVTLTGHGPVPQMLTADICAAFGLGKEDIRWKEIYQSSE